MMDGMQGMGWGMGLVGLLVLILLVLGIAALVKYLCRGASEAQSHGEQCEHSHRPGGGSGHAAAPEGGLHRATPGR